jgi:hypothetical protein
MEARKEAEALYYEFERVLIHFGKDKIGLKSAVKKG